MEAQIVDSWYGVTDPAKRRKLQNRLNQRAYSEFSPLLICLSQWFELQLRNEFPDSDPDGRYFRRQPYF